MREQAIEARSGEDAESLTRGRLAQPQQQIGLLSPCGWLVFNLVGIDQLAGSKKDVSYDRPIKTSWSNAIRLRLVLRAQADSGCQVLTERRSRRSFRGDDWSQTSVPGWRG